MNGDIFCGYVAVLYPYDYGSYDRELGYRKKFNQKYLQENNQHSFVFIFGPTQDDALADLKTQKCVKILFESKRAVNPEHPGTGPRNTVVVLEYVE